MAENTDPVQDSSSSLLWSEEKPFHNNKDDDDDDCRTDATTVRAANGPSLGTADQGE